MTEQEIKDLVEKGRGGILTPQEQMTLAHECWVYRRMALRLEASVHDLSKKVETQEVENDLLDDECTKRQLRIIGLLDEAAERAMEWWYSGDESAKRGDDPELDKLADELCAAVLGEVEK